MPLPERTIESAIDALKSTPGKFQRLVERYAQLTYARRFKELVPGGRAPGDVTVKGWPDIYARSPDRLLMDVVEATHSPEWSRHLKEDVEKAEALGKGRLSGFIFVAWANEPSPLTDHKKPNPLDEKLTSYRGRLVALGIPPENITFVFKKQLVRDLTQPNFASVLTEFLELQSHSLPFRTISAANIYGTPGQYDVFAPAKEEYLNGFVHRAAITGEVEKRLESLGWAWLRGRGAAGKTVLATHLGLRYEARDLPAYYLDLSKWEVNVSQALNVLTTHADEGVLFIIDNVHLNQASARDCFDHWQSVSGGSHLLLLGRDTTTIDFRGIALPLDDLREEALTLEVSQDDLEGVFLRLARRSLSSSGSVPRPPQDVLERWHRLFGGDLIAFSAAVAQRLKRLAQNEWAIQAQDAAKYVRAAYLGKADEAQRLNLLRLAVLAQLEMSVPEEALELTKLEPFLQNGLVHFVGRGRNNQNSYYHLVHPGLGDLLLTAVGYSDEELKRFISEQWGYISHRNPLVGTQIAARLESGTRLQEAALILKGIIAIEKGLEAILITPGLQYLRINSERLARLGILSESEIDQKLASLNSEIYQSALSSSLNFLAHSLRYAERKLPLAWEALAVEFQRPEGVVKLHEMALRTPLDFVVNLLAYAERKLPLVWEALAAEFQRPEGIAALREMALRTPLDLLVNFLVYAQQKLPLAWKALAAEFQRPEGIAALHEMALRAPLNQMASFLGYAERKLPLTWEALAAEFQRPEGIAALCEMALRAPLDQLASLLGFTEQKLPMLGQALTEKLTDPVMIKLLAETACRTPLSNLLGFLQTVTFAPTVVFAIDQDQWIKSRQEGRSEQPYYFPAIAKVFQRIGRPELSEAPAISLIKDANQQHWRGPGIGLHHLSYVMRLGRAAEAEVMRNFITRVATPTWLKELYSEAPAYGIAAALFGLWGYYEKAVLDHFCIEALKSRVRYELNNLSRMGLEDLSGSLQLLGVSALLGVRVGIFKINWPKVDQVNDLTQLVLPPAETTTIGYITIQLWLGLRVMAGMRPDHIYIQPALGEHVLALWKNSTGNTDKQNELNQWMIEWMQRCAQAEWRLIADHRKG
ncbi:MAG TPA: hypothetical protein VER76_08030 [Pyrinomonadaceae bacterium]|nr:hypothetical protein [Pyrinomonadaceae bacterium]